MNVVKIVLGFVFLVAVHVGMFAQNTDAAKPQILNNLAQNNGQDGQIEIVQPEQLEKLLKMHIANNRIQKGIPGYRIRIFSESAQTARQRSENTRMNFMRSFPYLDAYQRYNNPNWQVFVGDFRTKNEALREIKKIARMFPGAFIVSTTIFEDI